MLQCLNEAHPSEPGGALAELGRVAAALRLVLLGRDDSVRPVQRRLHRVAKLRGGATEAVQEPFNVLCDLQHSRSNVHDIGHQSVSQRDFG